MERSKSQIKNCGILHYNAQIRVIEREIMQPKAELLVLTELEKHLRGIMLTTLKLNTPNISALCRLTREPFVPLLSCLKT